jgi:hypothetical protein
LENAWLDRALTTVSVNLRNLGLYTENLSRREEEKPSRKRWEMVQKDTSVLVGTIESLGVVSHASLKEIPVIGD